MPRIVERRKPNKLNELPDRLGTHVYSSEDQKSMHKSSNGHFIIYQLLLEQIFDDKQPLTSEKVSLIEYFKPEDENDKKYMTEFDDEYKSEKAIHWYTRETCIYKLMNKSLRTQNFYDILPFSKLIRDLNHQLAEERKSFVKEQKKSKIKVYRGQYISKDEVNRLKTCKGELLLVNSLLSTSTNKKKALEFATSCTSTNNEVTSILLEIDVDLQTLSKPFADIKHLSAFSEEEEVLFMVATIFRIDNVSYDEEKKIWMGKFTLCSEDDKEIKTFTESLKQELDGQSRFIALGHYFIDVFEYDHAEEHFQNIIDANLAKDNNELAYTYCGLAQVNNKKGDYDLALTNMKKALEYALDSPDLDNKSLFSLIYNELGFIYVNRKDYSLALQAFSKALSINYNKWKTYAALSDVHLKMGNNHLALEHITKCIENQSKTAYALIGHAYIQMAKIYAKLNQKDKLTEFSEKALEYQLKELQPGHPDLANSYNTLGAIFLESNDDRKAFEYITKAYRIQVQSLGSNHPEYADTYRNFANLYLKQENLEKALTYSEKVLDTLLKTLPTNHPIVMEAYRYIEDILLKLNDVDKASIYILKLLNAQLERKQLGHTLLPISYEKLNDLSLHKDVLDESLELCFKLLDDALTLKLRQDIIIAPIYKTIAKIFYKKRVLDHSLIYYYRLLDCYLEQKPFDQSLIDQIYIAIGKVYNKKIDFNESLLYYEKKKKNDESLNDTWLVTQQFIHNIHFERCHLEKSCVYFQRQLDKKLKKHSEQCLKLDNMYYTLANIYFDMKNFDESLKNLSRLLNNLLGKKPLDDSLMKSIYKGIGIINFEKKDYQQSLIYFNSLLDYQLKDEKIDDPSIDETYAMIGKIYLKKNHFHIHPDYLNKFMEYAFHGNAPNEISKMPAASIKNNLQFEKRHLDQAFVYFRKLINKNPANQSLEDIFTILGNISFEKHDFQQAMSCFQARLTLQNKRNRSEDLSKAETYVILGNIYGQISQYSQASEYYTQVLAIYGRMHTMDKSQINAIKCKIRYARLPNL